MYPGNVLRTRKETDHQADVKRFQYQQTQRRRSSNYLFPFRFQVVVLSVYYITTPTSRLVGKNIAKRGKIAQIIAALGF